MTYLLGHVREVPPSNMFGHVPPPPPPVNQTLSRHDIIWQRSVTIYSDDILGQACLGSTHPPFEHVRARTPLTVNQTVSTFRHLATYCYYI